MNFILKLLKSFHYSSTGEFGESLAPSAKYSLTFVSSLLSVVYASVHSINELSNLIFGLDGLAFCALVAVLLTELISGIMASRVRKELFDSSKLRRFGFRLFYYLVLIGVPFLFSSSYSSRGKDLASMAFEWLHIFLVVQIVFENVISILENISVIDGKDKTHFISKIREKLTGLFI